MTARFEKETPDEIVNVVMDELLFYIRSKMASDGYISQSITKVIYVGPRESVLHQAQAQSQEGNASMIVAIVMSIVVILLVLLFASVVAKKRRRNQKGSSFQSSQLRYTTSETLPISDTEQTWRKALVIDETWRKALNTYERSSKVVAPDDQFDEGISQADPSKELVHDTIGGRAHHDESLVHARQDLEEGRKRRRKKKRHVAQDVVHSDSDRQEPSYNQVMIDDANQIEEGGDTNDQSVARDVQSPADNDEVVTVTSIDSEQQQNQSSSGIDHISYKDDNNPEVPSPVNEEQEEQLIFETDRNMAECYGNDDYHDDSGASPPVSFESWKEHGSKT